MYGTYILRDSESQLTYRSFADGRSRHRYQATRHCRDVTDGALGSYSEGQGSRATSSRGYFGVYTVSIHPYPACGALTSVTGAYTGRQGRHGNPIPHRGGQGEKGVKRYLGLH